MLKKCAVSQFARAVGAHCVKISVADDESGVGCEKAMERSARHHTDAHIEAGGKNLLGKEIIICCAITQTAIGVVTHYPEGAAGEVKTMIFPCGNLLDTAGEHLHRNISLG